MDIRQLPLLFNQPAGPDPPDPRRICQNCRSFRPYLRDWFGPGRPSICVNNMERVNPLMTGCLLFKPARQPSRITLKTNSDSAE